MLTDTRKSAFGKVHALDWDAVNWDAESFWGKTFKVCAEGTVPHIQEKFEADDISHVVKNFKIAAELSEGDFSGTPFGDGDFYKWMEAAMYAAAKRQDQDMFRQLDDYIQLIGKAQQPDGYISTKQIIGERQGTLARMEDINDFEVYNLGHLFTAASLYKRLTGKENFMDIAIKAAEYLDKLYTEAARTGEVKTAVCPSHYMGLIELYRTTGEKKYLDLAKLSIELRDSVEEGLDDNQDRTKLKTHEKIKGHAVRANYLYAGVADLYTEEGDEEYLAMLDKVWDNLLEQKIYITGGCGALYNGVSPYGNFWIDQKIHQAFGYEYQLPNVTAYNETCASLGHVFWAYRMFNLRPEAKYFDAIERAMLNVNLASISLDGKKFFYENMLRRAKELPYELCWPLERKEYLSSFCCPPNIARVLAQTSEYAYTVSKHEVWTGLYGGNTAHIQLENGADFTLVQTTNYPWDGKITFSFEEVKNDKEVTLQLRIPHWANSGSVSYVGTTTTLTKEHSESYFPVTVTRLSGATVTLVLDMPVRLTVAHPLVEENTNQAAVERGPLVYCIEGMDTEQETLNGLLLDPKAELTVEDFTIANRELKAITGEMLVHKANVSEDTLYTTLEIPELEKTPVRLVPYFAWDNRGYDEMKIWLPVAYTY